MRRALVIVLALAVGTLARAREPKKCGRAVAARAERAFRNGSRLAFKPFGCRDIALPETYGAQPSPQGLQLARGGFHEPLALLVDRVLPPDRSRPLRRIVREFAVTGHRQRLVRLWTEEVIP